MGNEVLAGVMIGEALIGRGIVDAMGLLSVYADWMLGVARGRFWPSAQRAQGCIAIV